MKLVAGLDLGQSADHSALCVVERVPLPKPVYRRRYQYVVRVLEEYPLGVSYPDQVRRTVATLSHPSLRGCRCAVDYTGVGRAVFDMLRDARPPALLFPVLTTGGHNATFDPDTREVRVPKTEQVSLLQVLLQADLVRWSPALKAAARLKGQLYKFRVRITKAKNETFGAEAGSNDDLVSAVMLACYLAEHHGGGDPAGVVVPDAGGRSAAEAAPDGVFHTGKGV
jgi:hypothetical protein